MMTQLRSAIVKNSNLARVFDVLDLGQLFDKPVDPSFFTLKNKADVVEAMVGELEERGNDHRKVFEEFLSYICYLGEKEHTLEVNEQEHSEEIKSKHTINAPELSLYVPSVFSKPPAKSRGSQHTEADPQAPLKMQPVPVPVPVANVSVPPKSAVVPPAKPEGKPIFFVRKNTGPVSNEANPVRVLKRGASQTPSIFNNVKSHEDMIKPLAQLVARHAIEASLAT